jgi:hypothetical protein
VRSSAVHALQQTEQTAEQTGSECLSLHRCGQVTDCASGQGMQCGRVCRNRMCHGSAPLAGYRRNSAACGQQGSLPEGGPGYAGASGYAAPSSTNSDLSRPTSGGTVRPRQSSVTVRRDRRAALFVSAERTSVEGTTRSDAGPNGLASPQRGIREDGRPDRSSPMCPQR